MIEYHPVSAKDRSRLHHHGKTVFTLVCALDMHCMRAGKGDSMVADMKLEKLGSVGNLCSRTQCNGSHHVERLSKKKQHIPDRRWNSQVVWKRSGFPKIHLNSGPPCTREHNDVFFKENRTGLNHWTNQRMTMQPDTIFLVDRREQHFVCITLNHAESRRGQENKYFFGYIA